MSPRIEHVLDCTTQQGVDRDYEERPLVVDPGFGHAEDRRTAALARLRALALTDEVVADLLTVLGVDDGWIG